MTGELEIAPIANPTEEDFGQREPDPRGEPWDEESEEFKKERDEWLERANSNHERFESFVNHIMRRPHDYGTIVWACLAAMGKGFQAVNKHPVDGGITGFQADCLKWAVLKHIFHMTSNSGHILIDYDWLLNPDCEEYFTTIRPSIWRAVVEQAKAKLAAHESGEELAPVSLRAHWEKIVAGMVPFGLKVGVDVEGE
jgi:hypothetical protein